MNRSDQRAVLEAFSKDFTREIHNLKERPDILWQQMYNRLQWADGDEGLRREHPRALNLGSTTSARQGNLRPSLKSSKAIQIRLPPVPTPPMAVLLPRPVGIILSGFGTHTLGSKRRL
jgi:hypothetical protein